MASANGSFNLSSQDNFMNDALLVYPNPTENILNLDLNENILSIAIYTVGGKLVKSFKNEKKIDLSGLNNSMYFLRIKTNSNTFNKVILKK